MLMFCFGIVESYSPLYVLCEVSWMKKVMTQSGLVTGVSYALASLVGVVVEGFNSFLFQCWVWSYLPDFTFTAFFDWSKLCIS